MPVSYIEQDTPHFCPFQKLMIANRGEIAVRIARSASDLGIKTVAIFSEDDKHSGHLHGCHQQLPLQGIGATAYLDIKQILQLAKENECDAIHPGYGFLSENPEFARACQQAGITFVGPSADTIALLGDKTQARNLAKNCGVPVSEGTDAATSLQQAKEFFTALPTGSGLMIKALAGGGGKGMRVALSVEELESAYQRCQTEAQRAFGNGDLYVEQFIPQTRHIEVQIMGDGHQVSHLWERECTLQRQHQKLVEYAPCPSLTPGQRDKVLAAATKMASACQYKNLGTFEFLLDLNHPNQEDALVFLEANPRLQVEHTVTEAILGLDLVQAQLHLAAGASLESLGLAQVDIPQPKGFAAQLRINMETLDSQGKPLPTSGTLTEFNPAIGPGIRLDTFAYQGYSNVTQFDSLLAKLIIHSPSPNFSALLSRASRALNEFTIEGIATNKALLQALLQHPRVIDNEVSTRFIEQHIQELQPEPDAMDTEQDCSANNGAFIVKAPLQGVVSQVLVKLGDHIATGSELALIEAMKLEHEIRAPKQSVVAEILVQPGDTVSLGQDLMMLMPGEQETEVTSGAGTIDLDNIRPDLQQAQDLIADTLDQQRPHAVERRRNRGQRTARENLTHLCDENSFSEYGQLTVAYLHARKSDEELRQQTPADGFVMGMATINAHLFGEENTTVAVGSYDATVMAGTQGHKNHQKTDRLFDLARDHKIPLVIFAEGGGGRPREDPVTIAALENQNFFKLAQLSGKVPVIGIVSGRCFAGNAVLLGMSDVIIATQNSNIGMAGPALIEAGGLGSFTPEQVGPISVQQSNGVVDIAVSDEQEAVEKAKQYLSYFQGDIENWSAEDQRKLRHAVPENRLRAYDVRNLIQQLADSESVLELRGAFGQAYVTALIRIEGKPLGVIANNPKFNSGAIDSDSADKASRFMRLCDAHGLPILTLVDTPGIMVGPEAETTALVRHSSRMFITAASLQVPLFAIVLRKAYGLGAMAAAGGHFKSPFFTIAWPTGELGGMGLEGGVRLAYKKEMEAISDPEERQRFFEERVASRYRKGKATYLASYFELDAVIDPADSRQWISRGLRATKGSYKAGNGRFIDTW